MPNRWEKIRVLTWHFGTHSYRGNLLVMYPVQSSFSGPSFFKYKIKIILELHKYELSIKVSQLGRVLAGVMLSPYLYLITIAQPCQERLRRPGCQWDSPYRAGFIPGSAF